MKSFIDHDDARKQIPQSIQDHLFGLIGHSHLPATEETRNKLIETWLLKKAAFQKLADHGRFSQAKVLRKDDKQGCLALTMSGSLVVVGPLIGGKREITYTSLGLRTDVPESLSLIDARLADDVECGKPIYFTDSRLEKTSAVTDLAVTDTGEHDSAVSLSQADEKLKANFIRFNRQVLEPPGAELLRNRNDLFSQWIIITWFLLGGLEKHVFLARAKILWLELFTRVYEALSRTHTGEERDAIFLDFTNGKFAKFCDDYKWYESEHKNFDIGLMKALEELPEYQGWIDFMDGFCNRL
jgi:hypothetical protein